MKMRMGSAIGVAAVLAAIAMMAPAGATGPPAIESPGSTTVQKLLYGLPTAAERNAGYDRDLFHLWKTVDGCDTRELVLARQDLKPPGEDSCGIDDGAWFSAYDGRRTDDPSTFDIDHVVPLAEAWDSGGYRWSQPRRDAFANDLTFRPSLIAVTASSNRSKGEQDPAEWMPERIIYWCTYLRRWISVKYRWQLALDPAEKAFILLHLWNCPWAISPPPIALD